MRNILILMVLISPFFYSCNSEIEKASIEKWKNEIMETEKEFADMAKNEGVPKAFLTYAAEDVVLMRNNRLIIGKDSLRESYGDRSSEFENVSLSWKPDFVDVSLSGDLGYTYGKYIYTTIDSIGNPNKIEGIFHTVWKRQTDGTWKFVWD